MDGTGYRDEVLRLTVRRMRLQNDALEAYVAVQRAGTAILNVETDVAEAFNREREAALAAVRNGMAGPVSRTAAEYLHDALTVANAVLRDAVRRLGDGPFRDAELARIDVREAEERRRIDTAVDPSMPCPDVPTELLERLTAELAAAEGLWRNAVARLAAFEVEHGLERSAGKPFAGPSGG